MSWANWLQAAMAAYGAYESNKDKKEGSERPQPTEQYRTPYMNEYLSALAPWLMQEQARIYGSRQGQYGGGTPVPFDLAAMFGRVPAGYAGVGKPGMPYTSQYGGTAQPAPAEPGEPMTRDDFRAMRERRMGGEAVGTGQWKQSKEPYRGTWGVSR